MLSVGDAIGRGDEPLFAERDDERTVYAMVARELTDTGQVSQDEL